MKYEKLFERVRPVLTGESGELVRWTTPGQRLAGRITAIRDAEFSIGRVPVFDIEGVFVEADGTRREGRFTVSRELFAIAEFFKDERPQVGDLIALVYRGVRGRTKVFDAHLERQSGQTPVVERPSQNDLPEDVEDSEFPF